MKISAAMICALWAAVMFLGAGCAGFRELFSEPPAGKRVEKKTVKKKPQKEYQSRRYNRDPLDALIFRDRTKNEDLSNNSNLSEAEKRALKNSLYSDGVDTRKEIDRIYYENEKKRKKRQDDIFGPSPFGR